MNLALLFSLIAVACYAALVWLAFRRGLRVRVNQLFALYLVTMLVWQVAYILLSLSRTEAGAVLWYRALIIAALTQFIVFFCFARALQRIRERGSVVLLGAVIWLATFIALAVAPYSFIGNLRLHEVSHVFIADFKPPLILLAASSYGFLGYGIAILVQGYRRSTSDLERNRLRYLLLANLFILLGTLANFWPALQAYPVDVAANIVSALLLSYAILRYRLLDITVVVRHGLAYALVTGGLALVYTLSILLFELLLQTPLGRWAFVLPGAIALLATTLLRPWRERALGWIDRLLFHETYDSRRMLQGLSRRTATVIDLDALSNMLLSEICTTMRLERAMLFLREDEGGDFVFAAGQGVGQEARKARLNSDHPVAQFLWHSEGPLRMQEFEVLPQFRSLWTREREDLKHLGAQLFLPLAGKNRLAGILAVGPKLSGASFTQDDEITLSTLANQIAVAVENAHLFASTRARVAELTALQDIGMRLVSARTLPAVLQVVVEGGIHLLHADEAYVALYDAVNERLGATRGVGADGMERTLLWGSAMAIFLQSAVRERKPAIISNIALHAAIPPSVARESMARAIAAHPLRHGDATIGALGVTYAQPRVFTREELRLLGMLSDQATLAIDNAQLLESEQAKRQLADTLYLETIAEKAKTETILKETFSGIVVTDTELRIVTFNSGAESITGFAAADVMGKRLPDVLGEEAAAPDSPLGQVMATGERVPPQERVIRAAGGVRDILQGAAALHDANGKLFGYLVSFADITRLKEVDRLKTDIVANVSHELRTPLASIKAYTELLLDNIEGDDRRLRDQFLRIIDSETDRLSELISDLLNLSRLEAGRFEVRKVQLDMKELLSYVMTLLEVQRRSRDVTIVTDVSEDLPPIDGDREMLTIILRNLLTNAIKFSHRGSEVAVMLRATDTQLVLQVVDHGIGIPEDAMPHLFQKFYRVHSSTESGIEGTGLGLVLTKQAVEAHGGTIAVESKIGVGTTFTVCLPWC